MKGRGFLGALFLACLALAALEMGCVQSNSGQGSGTGGKSSTGGTLSSGGSTATGGLAGGGTTGSGGATGSGGVTGRGGNAGGSGSTSGPSTSGGAGAGGDSIGSGGRSSAGGATGSGGTSASGGSSGTGGKSGDAGTDARSDDAGRDSSGPGATGGGNGTGGATASGGAIGSGGTKGTGGAMASGGATGSGGANGSGGVKGTGGATATGPVTTTCPGAVPAGITADWCSCDQWGQLPKGDATYYNDIWGSGAGPQCIWVAGAQWGTAANHPSGGSVKSYPNISYSPGKALSALNTYTSSFQITVPSGGAWEVAYDIWVQNGSTQIEIMLWVNYTKGSVFPASSTSNPAVSNVSTGGHSWDVYYGGYGGHDVVSLLRTSNTTSATVDIKAILNWIITNKGSFNTSWTLYQVQFGPEIVSDGGAVQSFVTNSFLVSSS